MPNEQTSVPLFTSGEVLTAANMNLSAGTGVPVFATTVTRDAAFGGAGEKVLAEGQLCYLSSTNVVQYYDGAAWATVGPSTAAGLTLISATTIGTTVGSVTVSGAFSATYDAYKIIVSGGVASNDEKIGLKLGASATGYYAGVTTTVYSTTAAAMDSDNNATSWTRMGRGNTAGININVDVISPFLATRTTIFGQYVSFNTVSGSGMNSGFHNVATSFTDFTLTPAIGTLTGGTIRVYGYQNS